MPRAKHVPYPLSLAPVLFLLIILQSKLICKYLFKKCEIYITRLLDACPKDAILGLLEFKYYWILLKINFSNVLKKKYKSYSGY